MLTQLEKDMITFTHRLNLNGLIIDAFNALEWNYISMSWGILK